MTFDLDAARTLHDREPHNPLRCRSRCTDEDTNPYTWPCPTATALGATGRSEWTNRIHVGDPAAEGFTERLEAAMEAAMNANVAGTGMMIIPKTITYDPNNERVAPDGTVYPICYYPEDHVDPDALCGADACAFREGHTSRHHTIYGDPFNRTGALTCPTPGCVTDPHYDTTLHLDAAGTWFNAELCTGRSPGGRQCELEPGHNGLHQAGGFAAPLYRWHPDPCPITSTDDNDRPTRCVLSHHHHGLHYFGSTQHETPRCTSTHNNGHCAMRAGHFGPHTTYAGINFEETDDDPA